MSGVKVIGALLRGHAPLVAVVPVELIKAGRLPDGTSPNALLVRHISLVDRVRLDGKTVRLTARISVMVRAGSYREQGEIIQLVRDACAGFIGDIADVFRVSVLPAGLGPDVNGPGNSFEQTQDFRVSFDPAA